MSTPNFDYSNSEMFNSMSPELQGLLREFVAKQNATPQAPDTVTDPFPSVPQELKQSARWVTWSGDTKQKQPFISGTSIAASTSTPEHLVSYEQAIKNIQSGLGYPHLGFVPEQPYVGLDLDSCRNPETGAIQPWAEELLGLIGSTYVEVTPSQAGLRAWVKMPIDKKKIISIDPALGSVASKAPQVEPLVHNYGTITGVPYNNAPAVVAEITEQRWSEIERMLGRFAPVNTAARPSTSSGTDEPPVDVSINGAPIPRGQHDRTLFRIAASLRQADWDKQVALEHLISVCEARCTNHGTDYRDMCEKKIDSAWKYKVEPPAPPVIFSGYDKVPALPVVTTTGTVYVDESEKIPAFDESVITGIYRDIVDVAVGGTTIPPQYAFLNAKVYFGARMAGKATFEGLDCDSSYYAAVIGDSGTGKGESWRRTMEKTLLDASLNTPFKVIHSADSGAGLKDAFFEKPDQLPVVCYVDEVTSLGHKAGTKKNPEILDTIVELADSHRISRVLAKRGSKSNSRTHDNARLSVYMCGQDGGTFMSAFAGRTKIGLFDRLYPEYAEPVEAADLPPFDVTLLGQVHLRISQMKFDPHMTMAPDTKTRLDSFWKSQPPEIRKKVRFRKHLMLDMYMAAFGRG